MPRSILPVSFIRLFAIRLSIPFCILFLFASFAQSATPEPAHPALASDQKRKGSLASGPSSSGILSLSAPSYDMSPSGSGIPLDPENRPDASSAWQDIGSAMLWSIGATALPIGAGASLLNASTNAWATSSGAILLLGGMIAGPSAGQWYLGSFGHGLGSSLVRVGGMALMLGGFVEALNAAFCNVNYDDDPSASSRCSDKGGIALASIGAFTYVGGAIYSLIDIPFAAERKQARENRYGLAPILSPGPQGETSRGLMAWARF